MISIDRALHTDFSLSLPFDMPASSPKKNPSNYSTSNSLALLFLTHQMTNPTLSSLTNLISECKPSPSPQPRPIKSQYQRLASELSRFESKLGAQKSTHLRLVFLSFLRLDLDPPQNLSLKCTLSGCKALLGWWSAILAALADVKKPVPASQKTAYYECILRLLSRYEWRVLALLEPPAELAEKATDLSNHFLNVLTDTLEHSIAQLTNRSSLSLSLAAFVGKVFAAAFFYLDGVSNALLFLLNVRNIAVMASYGSFFQKHKDAISSLCEQTRPAFPKPVRHMISISSLLYPMGRPSQKPNFFDAHKALSSELVWKEVPTKGQRGRNPSSTANYNAVPPPRGPVRGIVDPRGSWVKKWASIGSDVFTLFLRHHLLFAAAFLDDASVDLSPDSVLLAATPGAHVVWTHVLDAVLTCVKTCTNISQKRPQNSSSNCPRTLQSWNRYNALANAGFGGGGITLSFFNLSFLGHADARTNLPLQAVAKIFSVVRDLAFTSPVGGLAVKALDDILAQFATLVSAYDFAQAGLVLDLVQEFTAQTCICSDAMDWSFWTQAARSMLSTDSINLQLKALAFLFNVWDNIPEDPRATLLAWLVGQDTWMRFFCHWLPLVRSYYLRLVVWRLLGDVGPGVYFDSGAIAARKVVGQHLATAYEKVIKLLQYSSMGYYKMPDMGGTCPIVGRRLAITPITYKSSNDSFLVDGEKNDASLGGLVPTIGGTRRPQVRKIHPFEIFDDAVYSTTADYKDEDEGLTTSDTVMENDSMTADSASRSLSRGLLLKSTKSRSFTTLARQNSFVKKDEEGGNKILGFAFKMFKKSKSSTNVPAIKGTFTATGEEVPPLPKRGIFELGVESPVQSPGRNSPVESDKILMSPIKFRSTLDPRAEQSEPKKAKSDALSLSSSSSFSDDDSSVASLGVLRSKALIRLLKNLTNSKTKKRGAHSSTSLMSLLLKAGPEALPPPPEFQNRAPEVPRQIYKFMLVWSEESYNYQMYVLNSMPFVTFHSPDAYLHINSGNRFPRYPILPHADMAYSLEDYMETDSLVINNIFDEQEVASDEINKEELKIYEEPKEDSKRLFYEESNSISFEEPKSAFLDENGEINRKESISSFFTCSTQVSPKLQENSFFDEVPDLSIINVLAKAPEVPSGAPPPRRRVMSSALSERKNAMEVLKKWGAVGKALNEWNDTVAEFEEFVRMRKAALDNQRLMGSLEGENTGSCNYMPLLIAEAPAPKINAS